jgi:acyl phosphate:glycerol-3-phosphate acyltransferase
MLGHWRPLFLGFRRGGKIVATTGGAFLGVAPIVGGIGAGVWILVFLGTRYASLASIVAGLSLPGLAAAIGYPWPVIAFAGVAAAAIVVLHRANIRRLLAGTESRFALRRSKSPAGPSSTPAA